MSMYCCDGCGRRDNGTIDLRQVKNGLYYCKACRIAYAKRKKHEKQQAEYHRDYDSNGHLRRCSTCRFCDYQYSGHGTIIYYCALHCGHGNGDWKSYRIKNDTPCKDWQWDRKH